MNSRTWFAVALFAVASVIACGGSTALDEGGGAGAGADVGAGAGVGAGADDGGGARAGVGNGGSAGAGAGDGGGARAGADGADCANDAECSADAPKCTQAGKCAPNYFCDMDADCRGAYKFCHTFHRCEPCRVDADCPSETPVCAPGWESGVGCSACRVGDSSTCPAGTYCTGFLEYFGLGGTCEVANCALGSASKSCLACVNENARECLGDGDECTGVLATLKACYAAEVPGWTEGDCPTGIVPSLRGCTPQACSDEADAMDACLLRCSIVTERCGR